MAQSESGFCVRNFGIIVTKPKGTEKPHTGSQSVRSSSERTSPRWFGWNRIESNRLIHSDWYLPVWCRPLLVLCPAASHHVKPPENRSKARQDQPAKDCPPFGLATTPLMPSALGPIITVLPSSSAKRLVSAALIVSNVLFQRNQILALLSVCIVAYPGTRILVMPPCSVFT